MGDGRGTFGVSVVISSSRTGSWMAHWARRMYDSTGVGVGALVSMLC